jgi:general L-amino acid transport system substrate-binding protein
MQITRISALVTIVFLFVGTSAQAQTLKAVKDKGQVVCGVSEGLPGFSAPDAQKRWKGFDADFCRALAAAIFNDIEKVSFVPLSADDRFPALQQKKIDVLTRNTTWTLGREAGLAIEFPATTYYDGQGFMVRKTMNIESAIELADKKVCTQTATTTELNLADFFRNNRINYTAVTFPTADDALKGYGSGQCDALTSDVSQLHGLRVKLSQPADHAILPDVISKEPLGPVVRQDDVQWMNIVKWVHFAMINGEELNVGQGTIDEAMKSQKPDIRRLLGVEGTFGEQLGLTKDWSARVIRLVGNYAEVYERNLGATTQLAIPRGINSLWDKGGIQYAPPIR